MYANKYSLRSVSSIDPYQAAVFEASQFLEPRKHKSTFLHIVSSHLSLPQSKLPITAKWAGSSLHAGSSWLVTHASECVVRLISCTVTVTEQVSGAPGLKTQLELWGRDKPHKRHRNKKYQSHRRTAKWKNSKDRRTLQFRESIIDS